MAQKIQAKSILISVIVVIAAIWASWFFLLGPIIFAVLARESASNNEFVLVVIGYQFFLILLVIVGGYLTARKARQRVIAHAGIAGLVLSLHNIFWGLLIAPLPQPSWVVVLLTLVITPACMLGGYLFHLRNRESLI